MQRPYFEAVARTYYTAACELYKLAAGADFETADAANFIARGRDLEQQAVETWPLTTRQERRLSTLRARAEMNTPEGIAKRDRLIAKALGQS